jgi:nucleoside-diphosphate-sugar epimerase
MPLIWTRRTGGVSVRLLVTGGAGYIGSVVAERLG